MRYISKTEIIRLNQLTVQRHGGNFVAPKNLLQENALDYLVESVDAKMFGVSMYPKIHDKAGLYMFNIISNHIFQDGNKRTGLATALAFLNRNGSTLQDNLEALQTGNGIIPDGQYDHHNHLYHFTIAVASGQVTLEACQAWFAANTIKTAPPPPTR